VLVGVTNRYDLFTAAMANVTFAFAASTDASDAQLFTASEPAGAWLGVSRQSDRTSCG
jgi:hypothetical protein